MSGQPHDTSDGTFHSLQTEDNDPTNDWPELQSSDSEDDAQSDCSKMDGFVEHSYEVLFVPEADVQRVSLSTTESSEFRYI